MPLAGEWGANRDPKAWSATPSTHLAFLRRFARRLPFFLATLGAFFAAALRAVLERDFLAAIFRCLPLGGARWFRPKPLGYVARHILPRSGGCQRKKFSCSSGDPERMPIVPRKSCVVRACLVPATRPFRISSMLRSGPQKP